MAGRKWTVEEENFLIENAEFYSYREMGEKINRTKGAVGTRVAHLGITKIKNVTPHYEYNADFFESIDSEEKAYWLGFIAADGCVVEKVGAKKLKIALQRADKAHLRKFVESIDGDIKIYENKTSKSGVYYDQAVVSVNSTKMCLDLIELGVGHNKTKKMSMPKIDNKLMKHFVRGYIDGDGCLYYNIVGSRKRYSLEIVGWDTEMMREIQEYLVSIGLASKVYIKRKDTLKLGIYAKEDIKKAIELLYIGSNIYLDRKYDKALEMMQM